MGSFSRWVFKSEGKEPPVFTEVKPKGATLYPLPRSLGTRFLEFLDAVLDVGVGGNLDDWDAGFYELVNDSCSWHSAGDVEGELATLSDTGYVTLVIYEACESWSDQTHSRGGVLFR